MGPDAAGDRVTAPLTQLGRYRLLRRIAAGGMGEVYLGEVEGAANFTKQVAVKRILPHLAENESFVTKFIDEANLMVQLHHGNIVPVLELAEEGGELWLAMEYLPGRDLKGVTRRLRRDKRQMPPDLALWLATEICAGLDYAHQKVDAQGRALGIVHRDVSPANIVLGAGGEVKLVDFGIARARGGVHQSVSGALQGKFVYMSPEQADGRRVDARSDVYSAGLVLYELLCGVRPFEGESETETLRLVRRGEISSPAVYRPDLPETLTALVLRALAFEPADRYQTAGAMRLSLLHHLAVSESEADASAFARFLAAIFPEGVVPPAQAQPESVDDALLLQLGALTPTGGSPLEQTQTLTGASDDRIESRRPPDLVTGDAPSSSPGDRAEVTAAPTRPLIGRRFALMAGLALGVIVTLAALTWETGGQRAIVSASISPGGLTGVEVEVDDVALAPNARLRAGQTYKICVRAPGYAPACRRIPLEVGVNRPAFRLLPRPTLVPKIIPADVPHRVLLDQAPVKVPFPLVEGRSYLVCVEATDHRVEPRCRRVSAHGGLNAPEFRVEANPAPDAKAEARTQDAGSAAVKATENPAAATIPPRQSATKQGRAVLESIPMAEVWRGKRRIGVTPVPVPIGPTRVDYVLRAKGYADTHYAVTPTHRPGRVRIDLVRPGFLTVRVEPAASEIWLDEQRVATGVLNRHPLPPGDHQLAVRFYRDGRIRGRYGPVTVTLGAGKERRLPPIQVPLDDAGGGVR